MLVAYLVGVMPKAYTLSSLDAFVRYARRHRGARPGGRDSLPRRNESRRGAGDDRLHPESPCPPHICTPAPPKQALTHTPHAQTQAHKCTHTHTHVHTLGTAL